MVPTISESDEFPWQTLHTLDLLFLYPLSSSFFVCFGETHSIAISWERVNYRLYFERLHDFHTWLIIWQNFKWSRILLEFQMIVSVPELQVLLLRNLMVFRFSILCDFFSSLETLRICSLLFHSETYVLQSWKFLLKYLISSPLHCSSNFLIFLFEEHFALFPSNLLWEPHPPLTCATF